MMWRTQGDTVKTDTYTVFDAHTVARTPDAHGLQHAGVAELTQNDIVVKVGGDFVIVGFDAADEVGHGAVEGLHQSGQRLAELTTHLKRY